MCTVAGIMTPKQAELWALRYTCGRGPLRNTYNNPTHMNSELTVTTIIIIPMVFRTNWTHRSTEEVESWEYGGKFLQTPPWDDVRKTLTSTSGTWNTQFFSLKTCGVISCNPNYRSYCITPFNSDQLGAQLVGWQTDFHYYDKRIWGVKLTIVIHWKDGLGWLLGYRPGMTPRHPKISWGLVF